MNELTYDLVRKVISEKEFLIAVAKWVDKKSNTEIMSEFNIAKSTLKSKLKAIRKKLVEVSITL